MKKLIVMGLFCMGLLRADSIDVFAQSLADITASSKKEGILDQSPEIKSEITKESLSSWLLKAHDTLILANDKNQRIYQIKVLKQGEAECSIHSFRNCLYLLDIALSPRKEFDSIYKNMTSRKGFEEFATVTGCPLKEYGDYAPKIRKIIQEDVKKITCMPLCMPKKTEQYMNSIVAFRYYNESSLVGGESASLQKEFREFIEKNKGFLPIEEAEARDTSSLYLNDVEAKEGQELSKSSLLYHINMLAKNENYAFAVDLEVMTSEEHGTALLVYKQENVIEYFFADSEGISFRDDSRASKNYTAAIEKIVKFTQDPNYFNTCIIRYNYFIDLKGQQEKGEGEIFEIDD